MANTVAGLSPILGPFRSPISVHGQPLINFYKPHLLSDKQNPLLRSRLVEGVPKKRNLLFSVFGSLTDGSGFNAPEESKDSSEGQGQVASVDIKLPRRSLLVEFSCDSCGARTKRLINRLAYERGLVFVQCAGCLQHHKLVDNLGLIVEYDFRETSKDSGTDHVL